MKRILAPVAVAAAFVATPAMAQDTDTDLGGFFVGGVVGYDVVNVDTGTVEDDEGFIYGITAGYDVDAGPALVGVEVEWTGTSLDELVNERSDDFYAGVRGGLQVDSNDIVYLKAGYTNVSLTDESVEGVRIGAGLEHHFGGFVVRAEYRYSNYDVTDFLGFDGNANRNQAVLTIGGKF